MKMLSFEFSSEKRTVSLLAEENGIMRVAATACQIGGESLKPAAMVAEVLSHGGMAREDVDHIAIGLGPGSYAGIRIAIALAQGWQLAREVLTAGVSSVESIACEAMKQGLRGRIVAVVDAQRSEAYAAEYDLTETDWSEISSLRIVPFAEVQARAAAGEVVIGPDVTEWCPGGREIFPDAGLVGMQTVRRADWGDASRLTPVYLRAVSFVKAPVPREV